MKTSFKPQALPAASAMGVRFWASDGGGLQGLGSIWVKVLVYGS